jgi:hypothetical protein
MATTQTTCHTPQASRVYDYFVISKELVWRAKEVNAKATSLSTHWAVSVKITIDQEEKVGGYWTTDGMHHRSADGGGRKAAGGALATMVRRGGAGTGTNDGLEHRQNRQGRLGNKGSTSLQSI